jgi:hypothetical protein
MAEWEPRQRARLDDRQEIPEAFDLKPAGEEVADGVPAEVIEGTPRAPYKPKSKRTAYSLKMKRRIRVSKSGYQAMQLEAESTDTIAIGAFLVRLLKGSQVRVPCAHVNGEVWLAKYFGLSGRRKCCW